MAELECQSLKQCSRVLSSEGSTKKIQQQRSSIRVSTWISKRGSFSIQGIQTEHHVSFGLIFQFPIFQQLSYSAAVSSGSAMGSMMHHIERELQYRCNSDSSSVMGNNRDCSNTLDEGQQAELQQCRRPMSWISVMLLLGIISRAHSSLRGSVDFWVGSDVLLL